MLRNLAGQFLEIFDNLPIVQCKYKSGINFCFAPSCQRLIQFLIYAAICVCYLALRNSLVREDFIEMLHFSMQK